MNIRPPEFPPVADKPYGESMTDAIKAIEDGTALMDERPLLGFLLGVSGIGKVISSVIMHPIDAMRDVAEHPIKSATTEEEEPENEIDAEENEGGDNSLTR